MWDSQCGSSACVAPILASTAAAWVSAAPPRGGARSHGRDEQPGRQSLVRGPGGAYVQPSARSALFLPTHRPSKFRAPSASILERMQSEGRDVDPTFQFYVLDGRTGARQPVTDPDEVLSMLREFSPAAQ